MPVARLHKEEAMAGPGAHERERSNDIRTTIERGDEANEE